MIGHQVEKDWAIVDAGWMAMSRDRGTQNQKRDFCYGQVCTEDGQPIEGYVLGSTNQEHGIVSVRPGSGATPPDLPVGALVRILPNHACATAAQHAGYHVLDARGSVSAWWPRIAGW